MNDKQEAYLKKMEAQLNEWSAEIDLLKARAEKAGTEAEVEYQDRLETLRTRESAARAKLAELKQSGADAWESLKSGVESAMADLREGLK